LLKGLGQGIKAYTCKHSSRLPKVHAYFIDWDKVFYPVILSSTYCMRLLCECVGNLCLSRELGLGIEIFKFRYFYPPWEIFFPSCP
jgi:hypothetical protein